MDSNRPSAYERFMRVVRNLISTTPSTPSEAAEPNENPVSPPLPLYGTPSPQAIFDQMSMSSIAPLAPPVFTSVTSPEYPAYPTFTTAPNTLEHPAYPRSLGYNPYTVPSYNSSFFTKVVDTAFEDKKVKVFTIDGVVNAEIDGDTIYFALESGKSFPVFPTGVTTFKFVIKDGVCFTVDVSNVKDYVLIQDELMSTRGSLKLGKVNPDKGIAPAVPSQFELEVDSITRYGHSSFVVRGVLSFVPPTSSNKVTPECLLKYKGKFLGKIYEKDLVNSVLGSRKSLLVAGSELCLPELNLIPRGETFYLDQGSIGGLFTPPQPVEPFTGYRPFIYSPVTASPVTTSTASPDWFMHNRTVTLEYVPPPQQLVNDYEGDTPNNVGFGNRPSTPRE